MNEIECTKCIYNINNECKIGGWTIPKVGCPDGKAKPMSNADRIRSMTDEKLANFYFDFFFPQCPYCECDPEKPCPEHDDCKICLLEWMKQEATDD